MNSLNHAILTSEQEQCLIARIKAGDQEAQQVLLDHNEKLVYKTAMRFLRTASPDIQIHDLMQAGRMGVLHAVEKWDYKIAKKRNVKKFSTYATWWVYQYIRRVACKHRSGFSRSTELDDLSYAIQRHRGELFKRLKREPKAAEIARAARVPVRKIRAVLESPEIVRLEDMNQTDKEFHESIPDPSPSVEHISETEIMASGFLEAIENVMPRHAKVLRLLFGLNPEKKVYTLEQTGKALKVSKQRIGQLKDEALEYLRSLNN